MVNVITPATDERRPWEAFEPAPSRPGARPRPEPPSPGRRRTTRANLCTAVVMASLGLAAAHGQLGLPPAAIGNDGAVFTIGRLVPPTATVGRAETNTILAAGAGAEAAALQKPLPTGKGMWIYEFPKTEGGSVDAIVARAKATGLTHIYPRLGSHWDGFYAGPFLDKLLPAAHAAGLRVFGWDFPRLGDSLATDVERAKAMILYTTPTGHRLDGFSADIETINEGSHVSPDVALVYGRAIRDIAGPDFTLIATVPRPSPKHRPTYPYAEIVESFDAIAPMIYWLNRQPDTDVFGAMDELAKFGKPIFPVGQAYDGAPEGGRKGVPPPDELFRFMRASLHAGAGGVSFWSWQAANGAAWNAIRDADEFRGPEQPLA